MAKTDNRKLSTLYIHEVLLKYSDADHVLTMRDLLDRIRLDYGMTLDRRSVYRAIADLQEFGVSISTYEDNGKGYSLDGRTFDDTELRLLIDSVLSSRFLPGHQASALIEKLKGLSSVHFAKRVGTVTTVSEHSHARNPELFFTIDCLSEAIGAKRQVRFTYNSLGVDKRLHPRREEPYVVNPYAIACANSHYYLIANDDRYDNLRHYRLDRITSITVTEGKARPCEQLPGYRSGLDVQDYVRRAVYMFGDEPVTATIRLPEGWVRDILDWFGEEVSLRQLPYGNVEARVTGPFTGLRFWALQYGPYCEVISPPELREQLAQDAGEMCRKYSKEE